MCFTQVQSKLLTIPTLELWQERAVTLSVSNTLRIRQATLAPRLEIHNIHHVHAAIITCKQIKAWLEAVHSPKHGRHSQIKTRHYSTARLNAIDCVLKSTRCLYQRILSWGHEINLDFKTGFIFDRVTASVQFEYRGSSIESLNPDSNAPSSQAS